MTARQVEVVAAQRVVCLSSTENFPPLPVIWVCNNQDVRVVYALASSDIVSPVVVTVSTSKRDILRSVFVERYVPQCTFSYTAIHLGSSTDTQLPSRHLQRESPPQQA